MTSPAWRARYARSLNSRGLNPICRPARDAVRATRSISRSPTRSVASCQNQSTTPGERINTSQHFHEGERLDEVVVGARTQAVHAISDLAKRADDQHRCPDPVLPEAPDDFDPIDARQGTINGHHNIFGGATKAQALLAIRRDCNVIAGGPQATTKLIGGLRIVLDNENTTHAVRHDITSIAGFRIRDCIRRNVTSMAPTPPLDGHSGVLGISTKPFRDAGGMSVSSPKHDDHSRGSGLRVSNLGAGRGFHRVESKHVGGGPLFNRSGGRFTSARGNIAVNISSRPCRHRSRKLLLAASELREMGRTAHSFRWLRQRHGPN